jgi:hypothetical protein
MLTGIVGLLINLLILALIVVVILWVVDLVAGAIGFPPKVASIIKAIIILIALLVFIQTLTGGWTGFYHTSGFH